MRRFLYDRVPAWLRHSAVLVAIYIAVMFAVAHLYWWHDWDWRVYEWLAPVPEFSHEIATVDYHISDPQQRERHRRTLATFIASASRQHPLALILDIPFVQCSDAPCVASARTLELALRDAVRAGVRVFATVSQAGQNDPSMPSSSPLDPSIYAALTGYGHTVAVPVRENDATLIGDLYYVECYPSAANLFSDRVGAPPQDVWALIDVVRHPGDISGRAQTRTRQCDGNVKIPARYGPPIGTLHLGTQYQITDADPVPARADFANRYVVIGEPDVDTGGATQHSGSDLLAWVLSDDLARDEFDQMSVQTEGTALRVLVPAFSLVTVLASAALFFLLRRTRLREFRNRLPWIVGTLSFIVGMAALALFEYSMHSGSQQAIQPQVSLISLGVLTAAVLSGVRTKQFQFEELWDVSDPGSPERYDWDVFISYAHDETAWVKQHVYEPFRRARLHDGRALEIFFDTSSIRYGADWASKISRSIAHSRFIVPVYSDIYFTRPYCRFEITRALRKWINAGEESRCVLPIMIGHPNILDTVDDIQAKSIDDDPNLVEEVIAEIVGRLSRQPAEIPSGVSS